MSFPEHRPRRLRRTPALRALVRETRLHADDLIMPLFCKEGIDDPVAISSMPGQFQHTLESLRKEAVVDRGDGRAGVHALRRAGRKDAEGSQAWHPDGIGQRAIAALREEFGDDAVVMSDLCLDEYTDHGHCGVLNDRNEVDNDATLERYRRIARAQAEAGAHMVGPSGMMDGQVAAIREALDDAGRDDVAIMAYAAKFASALYGPFREAAEGAPRFGDRTGYQQDPANADEAMREIRTDIDEGADIVMVKPALPYLDIVHRAKRRDRLPDRRLPRERRVRDGEGGRRQRLARRAAHRARDPHVDPPRGRRPDPHLPREGRCDLASRRGMTASEQLFDRARAVIPGGVDSPVRAFGSVGGTPVFIDRGEGAEIVDVDGNRYVDLVQSWGALLFGHARAEIVGAATAAAARGTSFGAPTQGEVELAERIVEAVPGVDRVRLVNSGTEAAMSAIRLARGATGRDLLVKFEGCYHGHSDSLLAKGGGSGLATLGIPSSPGVTEGAARDTLTAPFNDLDAVRTLFAERGNDVAVLRSSPWPRTWASCRPSPGSSRGSARSATSTGPCCCSTR